MEKFDLESFPTSESAKKMLCYVSDGFYDKSYVGKWIFQVMGIEYDKALEKAKELPEQFFPETATWGLMYHEIKWGLPVRTNLSYEERRRLIYRKRDYRAPMVPYRIEEYLVNEINFEAHVADCNDPGIFGYAAVHPNIFKVTFIGEGTLDTKKVKEILNKIKQSHTAYIMEDMVMASIDNKNLETVRCMRLDVHAYFYFFKRILNGDWILDGSVSLGQIPIAEIAVGITLGTIRVVHKGRPCLHMIDISQVFHAALPCSICSVEIVFRFDSSKNIPKADIDRIYVNIPLPCTGMVEADLVTVKKNLWHLDGQVLMDGSRILDAEVREERL